MRNLITILLVMLCSMSYSQTKHNTDGSSVSINNATITAMEGTVNESTMFDIYLPAESLSSAVYNICSQISARKDTEIWLNGNRYLVVYNGKGYNFDEQTFDNKSDLVKYINPWLKSKLITKSGL